MSDRTAATQAITQLYARYADAVWRHDYDSFAACFTSDGEWRISGLELRGREEIRATIEHILARLLKVRISFATPILAFGEEDTAAGRIFLTEQCLATNGDTVITLGTYFDRFRVEDGRWRFAWRLFALDYRGPADLSGSWLEAPDYGPPPAMPPLDSTTSDIR